ncbi:MAG: chorismate synthase [Bacteroidales bacterium]|nr:chorismate synthase [Bacteroidales bacterium]
MNSFGRKFRVSIFGESHGELIGVVLDGVPAGLELSEQDFEQDILRRKSGAKGTTPRVEEDKPQIVSGMFEGHTTGAPLAIVFKNNNTHSSDYEQFAAMPRPGHADLTAAIKWDDCQDPRGSGHFSGRLTLPIVAAGVVAKKVLADATILDDAPVNEVNARIVEMGGVDFSTSLEMTGGPLEMTGGPLEMTGEAQKVLEQAIKDGDSIGAVVECVVPDIDLGYGEPFWDSVESVISHAIFSIPGVRGIEFGDGFNAAAMRGSEHNDPIGPDGRPLKNGAGGVNGGITNGAPIVFRVAFKPTSSISRPQQTFNFQIGEMDTLAVKGRHDVCFALRTPVIVEAMTAIALADLVAMK